MTAFKAACIQLRSTDDVQENIRVTSDFIREAHGKGAQFIRIGGQFGRGERHGPT